MHHQKIVHLSFRPHNRRDNIYQTYIVISKERGRMGLLFIVMMALMVLVVVIIDLNKKLHQHDNSSGRRMNQSTTTTTDFMSTGVIVSLQDTDMQSCSDTSTNHSDTSCASSFD